MKRLLILTLIALLVGAFAGCEKEKLITGPTEYDTTEVVDTLIQYDTLVQIDTLEVNILNELDYYHALQLWINTRLNPYGLDSYYPTVNTYDIKITIDSPTQMTFNVWWVAIAFDIQIVYGYRGVFIVVYQELGKYQITDITSITPGGIPARYLSTPVRTLR